MNVHRPNKWVILDMSFHGDQMYRILGGWSGGYLDGDSWRLGSPVVDFRVEADDRDDEFIIFTGESGSEYVCYRTGEGFNMITSTMYSSFQELEGLTLEVISFDEFIKENRLYNN